MKELYQRRRQYSQYWFNKASDLRAAAAAVWISMDKDVAKIVVERAQLGGGFSMPVAVAPVYEMLCGMALELIFKAITVERMGTVNEKTHNLLEHVKTIGIAYSAEEKKLLKILSHSATWEGRYPAPKQQAAMEEFQKLVHANLFDRVPISANSDFTVLRPNGALDWNGFSKLWGKASSCYFQTRDADPVGPVNNSASESLKNTLHD